MLQGIKSLSSQSIYDLCMMTYGTLDLLVKLCDDNNIEDVNDMPSTGEVFIYDDSLIKNQSISGIVFSSKFQENS